MHTRDNQSSVPASAATLACANVNVTLVSIRLSCEELRHCITLSCLAIGQFRAAKIGYAELAKGRLVMCDKIKKFIDAVKKHGR